MNQVLKWFRDLLAEYVDEESHAVEETETGYYARWMECDPNVARLMGKIERQDDEIIKLKKKLAELELDLKGQREGINNDVLQQYAKPIAFARTMARADFYEDGVIAALADEVQRLENELCNTWDLASGMGGDLELLAKPYMTDDEKAASARGNYDGVYAHTGQVEADAALGRSVRGMPRDSQLWHHRNGQWMLATCHDDDWNYRSGNQAPESVFGPVHESAIRVDEAALAALKEADNG